MQSEDNRSHESRIAELERAVQILRDREARREVEEANERQSALNYTDIAVRALSDKLTAMEARAVRRDEDEQLWRDAVDQRFVTPERLAEFVRAVFFPKERKV